MTKFEMIVRTTDNFFARELTALSLFLFIMQTFHNTSKNEDSISLKMAMYNKLRKTSEKLNLNTCS